LGFRVYGFGCRVSGFGVRVSGGFRVQGAGLRIGLTMSAMPKSGAMMIVRGPTWFRV